METIVINGNGLNDSNINKFGNKVRAILLLENKILVSYYGGVILLPGGSIDKGETPDEAIIRELKEETGIDYDIHSLNKILTIKYCQPNYPTRNDEVINRLIVTQYYLGQFKGIDITNSKRTESEIKDDFYLQLIELDDLLKNTNESSKNPRRKYFERENQEVVKVLKRKMEKR